MNIPSKPGAYCLIKNNTVIYVGKSNDLKRRYEEHIKFEDNTCIIRMGWDNFKWFQTLNETLALEKELELYKIYNPKCNLIIPSGS